MVRCKLLLFISFLQVILACQETTLINRRTPPPPDYGAYKLTDNPRGACYIENSSLNLFKLLETDYQMQELITRAKETIGTHLPDFLDAKPVESSYKNYDLGLAHISFQVEYEGIPVCGGPIRVHLRENNVNIRAHEKYSQLPKTLETPFQWGDAPAILNILKESFPNEVMQGMQMSDEAKKCLMVTAEGMVPAWRFSASNDMGSNYVGFVDANSLIKSYETNFHGTGLFQVYEENEEGDTVEVEVSGMQPNGYLCNNLFFTKVDLETEKLDRQTYLEASTMFVNANKISESIRNIGGNAWYPAQTILYLSSNPNLPTSFQPIGFRYAQDKLNTIIIPRSEGFLKNLRTDSDVLFHEYGHYLVYETAKDLSIAESFAIHDAYADFFAYMVNGDSCLAETICSDSSSTLCSVPGKCLRTADNDLHLNDLPKEIVKRQHYRHSELISGMLWDIKEAAGWSNSEGLSWLYNAIEYLDHSSNLDNMMFSLIESERDLFGSQNTCQIFHQATKRGFSLPTLQQFESQCVSEPALITP